MEWTKLDEATYVSADARASEMHEMNIDHLECQSVECPSQDGQREINLGIGSAGIFD